MPGGLLSKYSLPLFSIDSVDRSESVDTVVAPEEGERLSTVRGDSYNRYSVYVCDRVYSVYVVYGDMCLTHNVNTRKLLDCMFHLNY